MKFFLGLAALLLIGAVVWTIWTIFHHPKITQMNLPQTTTTATTNRHATQTVNGQATSNPVPTATNNQSANQTANNNQSGSGTQTTTGRQSFTVGQGQSDQSESSGNITTTITTETIDQWGNRSIVTKTETANW